MQCTLYQSACCVDYPSLRELYAEWQDGILLNSSTKVRQWPLKVLERRFKLEKKEQAVQWRYDGRMRKHLMERLNIIYGILRRLPDPAGQARCSAQ